MGKRIKTYSELVMLASFEERFQYLRLDGVVGEATFGFDRYMNQRFYKSLEWQRTRDFVIVRDGGCDLGICDRQLFGKIVIHHLNPLSTKDIKGANEQMLNPENLVCCSHATHNAIHFGDEGLLVTGPIVRSSNDTCPWKG